MQNSVSSFLPACRLGDTAFMFQLPEDVDADEAAALCADLEANRSFVSRIGAGCVFFADFSRNPGAAPNLVLVDKAVRTEAILLPGLQDFFAAGELGAKAQSAVLKTLVGTVARLFRLQRDQRYASLLADFAGQAHLPRVSIPAYFADHVREVVLRLPPRSGLASGALVVALGEVANDGEITAMAAALSGADDATHLAHVKFSSPLSDVGSMLAIDDGRVLRLDGIAVKSTDIGQFHNDNIASRPDVVAFLACHGSAQTRQELGVASLQGDEPGRSLDLERLGFHFDLDIAESLDEGLFLSGWFHDPFGHLTAVDIIDYSLAETNLLKNWRTFHGLAEIGDERVAVTGFCAWMERSRHGPRLASPSLVVTIDGVQRYLCRAGRKTRQPRMQRANLLSVIHPDALDNEGLERAYAPAMASITKNLSKEWTIRKTVDFGRRSARSVSVIVPLYRELGFIRSQILAFSVDPFFRGNCEIIYVVDDPTLAGEVLHQIGGMARLETLDIRVVVLKANCGFGPANNLGASVAEGRHLVLMNSDVVPSRAGWLEGLLETLLQLPEHSVVGPKLLYADETAQHAGMYFFRLPNGLFQNMHYYKGYGRSFTALDRSREVPAVTGALMVLAKASFAAVGGFDEGYVIGDYEDSDLCLKLREIGGIAYYQPAAELYHFERQSMAGRAEETDSGSTLYNRCLHHSRWAGRIEELMMNPAFQDGRNAR